MDVNDQNFLKELFIDEAKPALEWFNTRWGSTEVTNEEATLGEATLGGMKLGQEGGLG